MTLTALTALSPLDGRYAIKTAPLRAHLSEFGLIRARVAVEVAWLKHLSSIEAIGELPLPRHERTAQIRPGLAQ